VTTVFARLLVLGLASQAPDAGAPVSGLEVVGGCPARDAVIEALLPVVGKDAPLSSHGPTRVMDMGDRFDVTAAGQAARYVDTARDCGARARVAAVFIALALTPPSIGLVAPAPSRDPQPPPPSGVEQRLDVPPTDTPSPLWARLTVAARLDTGAASDLTAGGEIAGLVGRGRLGIAISAALLAPTRQTLQSVSVRQQRFPFTAGVVLRHRVSPSFELSGKAALALVLLTLRGENVSPGDTSTRLDPGANLSIELSGPPLRRGLVPFVGVHAELFPRGYVLDVVPVGEVGVTNRFWWGAAAGLSFDLARGE